MNNNACDDSTNQPVSLNNEDTPDAAVFAGTSSTPTVVGAASDIVPDAHILSSGQKQHTKPFSTVKMKKIAKKYTIDTPLVTDTPTTNPVDAST